MNQPQNPKSIQKNRQGKRAGVQQKNRPHGARMRLTRPPSDRKVPTP